MQERLNKQAYWVILYYRANAVISDKHVVGDTPYPIQRRLRKYLEAMGLVVQRRLMLFSVSPGTSVADIQQALSSCGSDAPPGGHDVDHNNSGNNQCHIRKSVGVRRATSVAH